MFATLPEFDSALEKIHDAESDSYRDDDSDQVNESAINVLIELARQGVRLPQPVVDAGGRVVLGRNIAAASQRLGLEVTPFVLDCELTDAQLSKLRL